MIRVVLDTNVVVSALLRPDGPPAAVLLLILSGRVQSCVSPPILAEYQEVLRRPRFKLSQEATDAVVQAVRRLSHRVTPPQARRSVQRC